MVCGHRLTIRDIVKAKVQAAPFPVECCEVPDYIGLRAFATQYYGKVWYRNPDAAWSQAQLQSHYEEVVFMSNMYHIYRFGNYSDLTKFFEDYDAGDIIVVRVTRRYLPSYTLAAIDPDTDEGKWFNSQVNPGLSRIDYKRSNG